MKRNNLIIWSLLFVVFATAQDSKKIKNLELQQKTISAEIASINEILKETKRTTNTLLPRIALLDEQIRLQKESIELLNKQIKVLDEDVKEAEEKIDVLDKELAQKKEKYAISLRKMQYNKTSQDKLLFILSAESLSQSYHRLRYLKEYASWQKLQGKEIVGKQEELEKEKQALEITKKEKLALVHSKEAKNLTLQKEEDKKQAEVNELKKTEKSLEADLNKKKKQAEALNRQIEKAIEEEIAAAEKKRIEAEEKAKKSGKSVQPAEERVAESTGGYAMTKEERTLSGNFASNKGFLPYPLKGSYKIVGRFGVHQFKDLAKVQLNSNGIDIQTTPNNDALAVFDGVVTSIHPVPGYNNLVMIRHGNYLTIYANLKEVYVKYGSKVAIGQAIGKIFTDTENGNLTILHFELWKEQTKLNPEGWLRR